MDTARHIPRARVYKRLGKSETVRMGIALWLVPPPSVSAALSRLQSLAAASALSAPATPIPHVTLASFPSCTPLASLRAALSPPLASPLHLSFSALRSSHHFFRSLLVSLPLSPPLARLHQSILTNIDSSLHPPSPQPLFPHLSLLYIQDTHASDRERTREALCERGIVRNAPDSDGVEFFIPTVVPSSGDVLNEGEGESESERLSGFDVSHVWIVQCEGPVHEWKVLDKISLLASQPN